MQFAGIGTSYFKGEVDRDNNNNNRMGDDQYSQQTQTTTATDPAARPNNTDGMDWEDTLHSMAGLFDPNATSGIESPVTKAGSLNPSLELQTDTTKGPICRAKTVELQNKIKTYLSDQKLRAVEAAMGNLGPMRLAYESNYKHRVNSMLKTNLNGSAGTQAVDSEGLYSSGDGRSGRAIARCSLQAKENLSFSFTPETWKCSVCINNPGHGLAARETILLVDQAYPATLGSCDSRACFKIVRMEFGTLSELSSVLIRIGRNK